MVDTIFLVGPTLIKTCLYLAVPPGGMFVSVTKGHFRKDLGWSGGEGTSGLDWGLLRKEWVSLGLAGLNNVGGLRAGECSLVVQYSRLPFLVIFKAKDGDVRTRHSHLSHTSSLNTHSGHRVQKALVKLCGLVFANFQEVCPLWCNGPSLILFLS